MCRALGDIFSSMASQSLVLPPSTGESLEFLRSGRMRIVPHFHHTEYTGQGTRAGLLRPSATPCEVLSESILSLELALNQASRAKGGGALPFRGLRVLPLPLSHPPHADDGEKNTPIVLSRCTHRYL